MAEEIESIKQYRKDLIIAGKNRPEFKAMYSPKKHTTKHDREKYCTMDIDNSGAIKDADIDVLYALIKQYDPQTIAEVGTWFGTSAMVMDRASGRATIHTCDKHKLVVYESPRVIFHHMKSAEFFKTLLASGIMTDFVFMDGSFRDDDYKILIKIMKPKCVFVVHDYGKGEKGHKDMKIMRGVFKNMKIIKPSEESTIAYAEVNRG